MLERRYVEWTGSDAVPAADAYLLVPYYRPFWSLLERSYKAGRDACRFFAVHALHLAVNRLFAHFVPVDHCIRLHISSIRTPLFLKDRCILKRGLGFREIVGFVACGFTASASYAPGQI